jgi:Leucine-rich repeat (LRR) protein
MKSKNLPTILAIALPVLGFAGCDRPQPPPLPTRYPLTIQISPSGAGTVTRSIDQAQYPSGTVVTLTAAPAAGYAFDHWAGDAAGSANPTTITMNAGKTVTAVFAPTARYALAIAVSPPDGGDVSRSPDQAQYPPGTVVALTAVPAVGYAFDHWEGDAAGTDNLTTVTMNADKAVTAVFAAAPQYSLNVGSSPSDGGNVSRSPDQALYIPDAVVTLSAAPAAGYAFDHWEGDAAGTANPTTITMNASKTVTAVFAVLYPIPDLERRALIALYNETGGDAWTDNSGWKTPPLDSDGFALPGRESIWFGVTVDPGIRRVTGISLSGNNLIGAIPSEIGDLAALKNLDLSNNQLTGSIPGEIGNLPKLYHLTLSNSHLTGSIPPEIGNLSQLGYLFLDRNMLTGPIPLELCRLPNLVQLYLYSNLLSGPIPAELGNMTSLRWIVCRDNQFTGEIPPELGNLTGLEVLRLGDNQLSGTIPAELGNLVGLQSLRLRNNRLGGEIPATLGNLTQLWELLLDANQLKGPLPTSLANLAALTETNIGYNALFTSDEALIAFLDTKDPDWAETQTTAPTQVTATPLGNTVILVSWLPIVYSADAGYYKVLISETPGGPYTLTGQTADKTAPSLQVTGLRPGTRYYVVVQTHTDMHVHNMNIVETDDSAEATAVTDPLTPGARAEMSLWAPGANETAGPRPAHLFISGRRGGWSRVRTARPGSAPGL